MLWLLTVSPYHLARRIACSISNMHSSFSPCLKHFILLIHILYTAYKMHLESHLLLIACLDCTPTSMLFVPLIVLISLHPVGSVFMGASVHTLSEILQGKNTDGGIT